MASPGTSPFGSTSVAARLAQPRGEAPAPILSSTATAGTLSDICSALRTATVPWKLRSKFSGA